MQLRRSGRRPWKPSSKQRRRNEMMSPLPAFSPCARESTDTRHRGPISERARVVVDVGADRGFAVAAAVGRDRLTVAGAAAGSIASTVRHELDVVRDDLGGMALLAVLAFPLAKGQLAEDNDRLALLQPLLSRLRRLAEAQALVPLGHFVVVLAAVHCDRELHALGLSVAAVETEHFGVLAQVAHQLHFCESHLVSSFCASWRALLCGPNSPDWPAALDRALVRRSDSCGGTDVPLHDESPIRRRPPASSVEPVRRRRTGPSRLLRARAGAPAPSTREPRSRLSCWRRTSDQA